MSTLHRIVFVITLIIQRASAITCYECSSTSGYDCKYISTTCSYGFFGCVKIATYSGGVDKYGTYQNQDSHIITMNRGCSIVPLGGVDMCNQNSLLGYRIVICYCFNDFCNSAPSPQNSPPLLLIVTFIIFSIL